MRCARKLPHSAHASPSWKLSALRRRRCEQGSAMANTRKDARRRSAKQDAPVPDPTQHMSLEQIADREQARFEEVTQLRKSFRFRQWLRDLRAKGASMAHLDDARPTAEGRRRRRYM